MKNYYRFPSRIPHRASAHGVDGIFAWTIFIFLLMGFALFCWIGSFYVFGHPEKAGNYHLLMRLHKLEEPQRFELTEAPRGEFLKPKQLLERFGSLTQREMRRVNDKLLANFLRNYHQTHDLTPYVTEKYRVLASFPLTKKNFFYPGMCALLQSVNQPEILLEQIFPAANTKLISRLDQKGQAKKISDTQKNDLQAILDKTESGVLGTFNSAANFQKNDYDITPLEKALTPGQEIQFEKPLDLSAILHVEKLPDGHLKLTTISLLYGSYGPTSNGPVLFSLAPPSQLNVEAGLPLLSPKDFKFAEEQYAAYRTRMGFSNQEGAQKAEPSSEFVLQIISNRLTAPAKKTFSKNVPRAEKATPIATAVANKAVIAAPVKVAKALPLNTNAVLPATSAAIPTAVAIPASPITATEATVKAVPVTPSSPSIAEATPSLAAANQSVLPAPATFATTPSPTPTETNVDTLYDPGKMPRGRFVGPSQLNDLASQGLAGERLYIQGDFTVTASGRDRSVLRYQPNASASLTADRIAKIRIVAAYPSGTTPPAEGTTVSRNQDRPFMITDVKKGDDGTINLYVKEVVK